MSITPTWITVDPRTTPHRPWCAEDCRSQATGVHTSDPAVASAAPGELTTIAVRLEQLIEATPITMLAIELTEQGSTSRFLLPVRQGVELQRALQETLDLPNRT